MKREVLILLAIFLLVFVPACKKQETAVVGKAFVGGSKGLTLSFLPGAPPDSVFDTDNPFAISIRLENVGEFNIDKVADATVEITGIDPADFGVTKNDLHKDSSDTLTSASLDSAGKVVQGSAAVIDFDNLQYKKKVSGTFSFPLIASVCYEYGTKAQSQLCVLKDLAGKTTEIRFCDPNNQNIASESSGAPVQVVSMSENVLGSNKVAFSFRIRNVGTGTLHQQGKECSTAIADKDKVWVEVMDTGLGALSCSGLKDGTDKTGYVTLFNNEATVRCTQTVDTPTDLVKVIDVNLRYGYKESIQKTLQVKESS